MPVCPEKIGQTWRPALTTGGIRCLAAFVVLAIGGVAPTHAAEATTLFPSETQIIVALNLREFLGDHRNTEVVQNYLDQWRFAVAGDEKKLEHYYRKRDLLKYEGISLQDFLDRARQIKKISNAFNMDVLEDVDRITCGLSRGRAGFWTVVVEGRFDADKFKPALKQLAGSYFGSCGLTQAGGMDIFQVPDQPDGACVTLMNTRTLALADSKKTMTGLLALAAGKKHGLAPGIGTLLDKGGKEYAALAVSNVDRLLEQARTLLQEDVSGSLDPGDVVGKLLVTQAAELLRKHGQHVASACIGLSPGEDGLRLQLGLEMKKPETARELAAMIDNRNVWGGVLLKAIDNPWTQQLANILLRVRAHVKDATLVIRAEVPYEFIQRSVQGPWLSLLAPELASSRRQTMPLPGQAVLNGLADRAVSIPLWKLPMPRPPGGAGGQGGP